nr:MAG TPA: ABC transporter [Caudoviricetes sp.]
MKMQRKIRFKKCGISNQPDVCIFDDPCLSKFGALRGSCPHPGDNL